MNNYENKDNTLILFDNSAGLVKNMRAPNYTGTMVVEGKEYRVSLWERSTKNGAKYLSGNVQPPTRPGGPATAPRPESPTPAAPVAHMDDDLPF